MRNVRHSWTILFSFYIYIFFYLFFIQQMRATRGLSDNLFLPPVSLIFFNLSCDDTNYKLTIKKKKFKIIIMKVIYLFCWTIVKLLFEKFVYFYWKIKNKIDRDYCFYIFFYASSWSCFSKSCKFIELVCWVKARTNDIFYYLISLMKL